MSIIISISTLSIQYYDQIYDLSTINLYKMIAKKLYRMIYVLSKEILNLTTENYVIFLRPNDRKTGNLILHVSRGRSKENNVTVVTDFTILAFP